MPDPRNLKVGDRFTASLTFALLALTVTGCKRVADAAPAEPTPGIRLPVVDGAPLFEEKDAIVVSVRDSATAAVRETRTVGTKDAAWIVALDGEVFQGATREWRERLAQKLLELGRAGPYEPSERPLLLRADARAPFEIIGVVIEQAAVARIPHIFYATGGGDGSIRAISCPLPRDFGGISVLDLSVELSWDAAHGSVRRVLGPVTRSHAPMVGDPLVDSRQDIVSTGPDGDVELEAVLRRRFGEMEAIRSRDGDDEVELNIRVAPLLEWRHVVEFVHRATRSGTWRIGFAL